MSKMMLINMAESEECRIAVVENGRLEEAYLERDSENQIVGNIYLGRVVNVEPSMQAAFVDFGSDRNGFLHISDVFFDAVLNSKAMKKMGLKSRYHDEDPESNKKPTPKTKDSSEPQKVEQTQEVEKPKGRRVIKRVRRILRRRPKNTSVEEGDSKNTEIQTVKKEVTKKTIKRKSPKKRPAKRRVSKKESKTTDAPASSQRISLRKKPQEKRPSRLKGSAEKNSKERSRKDIQIQDVLKPGQMIVVQVSREAIDHKGASLTTFLSLAGRTLVLMPYQSKIGISRKIQDHQERQKLREILTQLEPPKNMGFIIRTSGVGKSAKEFKRDLKVLSTQLEKIKKSATTRKNPCMLYEEANLAIRALRDVYSDDIKSITIDSAPGEKKIRGWLRSMIPGAAKRLKLHEQTQPLFAKFKVEEDFEQLFSPRVNLPGGSGLVIEQTEALVSIDVNTARMKDKDQNTAIFNANKAAAVAIPHQLRLRDLGGLIVCDFIDMVVPEHRKEIEKLFANELKKDRSRVKCSRISQFGLIEVSRQRMRQSVERAAYESCPTCNGFGKIKNEHSMALKILRQIRAGIVQEVVSKIHITAQKPIVEFLQNEKRAKLLDLETKFGKMIYLYENPDHQRDDFKIQFLDASGQETK